ncbi:Uma2 family endonuclease, partial [Chroococcus sp. FPU101]|uniref:Uma2 family endonuclease n=1 Tax=Chroococcus sp. FPU101 TaxID=1974212 RepID=UPI001F5D3D04
FNELVLTISQDISYLEQFIKLHELRNTDLEHLVIINQVSWEQYEAFLEKLGDRPGIYVTYLEGSLEIMSPSRRHELSKKLMGILLEAHFLEFGIRFYALGSTTFRSDLTKKGIEPDECYCIGTNKEIPDLAIEIVLTSGGVNSLKVYKDLGVPEVWFGFGKKEVCSSFLYKMGNISKLPTVNYCPT